MGRNYVDDRTNDYPYDIIDDLNDYANDYTQMIIPK